MISHRARHPFAIVWFGSLVLMGACSASDNDGGTTTAPPSAAPLSITTPASLPGGRVEVAYDVQLDVSGSSGAPVWTITEGALPSGLVLSHAGRIAGTPNAVGTSQFSVRVVDGARSGRATFTVTVEPPPFDILPETLPLANIGADYSASLTLAGTQGNVTWSIVSGALPTGLTLNVQGTVRGVPITIGRSSVRIRAVASNKLSERDIDIRVLPPPVVIETITLPNGNVGGVYAAQLERRGGDANVVWEVVSGGLPPGLHLSPGGQISGTPTTIGIYDFTVSAFSDPQRATQRLRLEIEPPFTLPTNVVVDMPGDFFSPLVAHIALGGSVTWRFPARPHNVVFIPTPGAPESTPLVTNTVISRTFPVAGTFRYDCTIHPGMSGIVVVGRP